MGRPMAGHLLAAGHRLTVFNRSLPAITELVEIAAAYKIEKTDVGATLRRDAVGVPQMDLHDFGTVRWQSGLG